MRQCPFTGCLAGIDDAPETICCAQRRPLLSQAEANRCACALADHREGRMTLRDLHRLYGKVCVDAAKRKKRRAG